MALARSAYQPLWTFSRSIKPNHGFISNSSCFRCKIRQYSDQQIGLARSEGEQETASSSSRSSSERAINSLVKNPLLFNDNIESMPGLGALDELNPYNTNLRSSSIASSPIDDFEVWRKTMERVRSSFTFKQLWQMSVDSKVPKRLFKSYQIKRGQRPSKTPLVKALLTHRFNMKDPNLEAELETARLNNRGKLKSLEMPITQIALLLLVLRGQSEMQRLLQLHRVKMNPFKKNGDEDLALFLQGSEESIKAVQDWVSTFCESIRSSSFPLSTFSMSSTPVQPPTDHRLRLISQRSQTIVSLDDKGETINIYSVEDTSLKEAQSLIVQSVHDFYLSQKRQFYSYASPPIPSDTVVSVPTYGFVPYVSRTPVSWLADPGPTASLFRITRQDIVRADETVFSTTMQDNPDKPNLRSLKIAETYNPNRSTSALKDDAFDELRNLLHISDDANGYYSYTAEFGHLLFENHDQAESSRLMNLITPPLSGTWPLEHSLEWLRKATQNKDSVSTTPSFCSVIPPLAASMDSGLVPSISIYNLNSVNDADASPMEKMKRRSEYWAEQFQQFGFPLRTNAKHQLEDVVDVDTSSFSEDLLISYAGSTADLSIHLQFKREKGEEDAKTIEEEAGMVFHGAQWVQRLIADVLVPESSVDVRLGVKYREQISKEALLADEGLQWYLKGQKIIPAALEENPEVQEQAATLPHTAIIQGQKVSLISVKRVCRWEWDLFDNKIAQFKGKLVMEKAIQDEAKDNFSTFKIVFDEVPVAQLETSSSEDKTSEVASGEAEDLKNKIGKEEEDIGGIESSFTSSRTPAAVWRVMQPLVSFFLARGYRSLPR